LGVIKSSVSEGNLILLENDNPGFKWEYEHQNLIGFISELVSVNMEYFQRIETDGKLREAYQLAKIGAWEIEKGSNKIFWSEAMFEFYGMDAQTDAALSFEEVLPFIHPDDVEQTAKAYYSLVNDSIPYKITCRHILGNGQLRYFEKSAMVRRSSNNKLLFMGVTVDITEKRIAELEQYRRRWRNTMRNAVGSAISPVSTKEELIEVFGNTLINSSSFKEICSFEISKNDVESDWNSVKCFTENGLKKSDSSASHIDQIKQMAKGLLANKGTLHLQFGENDYLMSTVQFPNENTSFLLFTLASESEIPVGEKLNLVNELVQVLQERAERIYAEQQLKELNTELLDTNLQMRQYSFIVSHNLRAPVANILGCLNLYNDQEQNDIRNKRLMDGIKVSAHTVDNILQDLSKILNIKENISKQFEYIPFDKTLELVLDSLHKDMHEVDYEMNVDFSGLAGMRAFRPYLVSIFQNMLSNSFKYRNPQRKLQLSIRAFEDNGKAVLQFADNGRGIDLKKYGNTIFKLYSRFHKDIPGSGIGLNMVQEQARAMGGNTQIDSAEGVGTTFTFTFVGKE
jgi:signal transduction histidine kinase